MQTLEALQVPFIEHKWPSRVLSRYLFDLERRKRLLVVMRKHVREALLQWRPLSPSIPNDRVNLVQTLMTCDAKLHKLTPVFEVPLQAVFILPNG